MTLRPTRSSFEVYFLFLFLGLTDYQYQLSDPCMELAIQGNILSFNFHNVGKSFIIWVFALSAFHNLRTFFRPFLNLFLEDSRRTERILLVGCPYNRLCENLFKVKVKLSKSKAFTKRFPNYQQKLPTLWNKFTENYPHKLSLAKERLKISF